MWNFVGAKVTGCSHVRSNTPCQDAFAHRLVANKTLIIAIADGAGSSAHSDLGAQSAVQAALDTIQEALEYDEQLNYDSGLAICDSARTRLFEIASAREIPTRDLACTLLFAAVSEGGAFFGQLGDGAWLVTSGAKLIPATWPFRGEYANETCFLTSPGWSNQFEYRKIGGPIDSIVGFTDGIQSLVLHYQTRTVFEPAFEPLLDVVRYSLSPEKLAIPLEDFLSTGEVRNRTDDDRTLVLASRRRFHLLRNGTA